MSTGNREVIDQHLSWLRRGGATTASLKSREGNVRRLAKALPVELLDATARDLDAWQRDLMGRPGNRGHGQLSSNTLHTYTAEARAFYRWAFEAELIEQDPTSRLPIPSAPRGQARPIPEADLRLLLDVAPEPIRTWLLLAAFMGLRCMDIAELRGQSIEDARGRMVLCGIGKGRKPFRLVVPQIVEPALRSYRRTGPLWTTPRGYRLTAPAVSEMVNRWIRHQGMTYTMHQARHSFGTQVYAQTKDLLLTQEVMRHSSPATTRIYVETSSDEAVAAADAVAARMLGGGAAPAG